MKKSEALKIRSMLDVIVDGIGATDEASFNAAAAIINENAIAIRTYRKDVDYVRGDLVVDPADGVPYWALHDHGPTTGQVHQPSASPTMWAHCHGTSVETAREFVAESYNPYQKGHYCIENGNVYCSNMAANVYAPSAYAQGWDQVTVE
ncbi:MAG: hypothetical protein Q4A66_10375 [Eubacteriales bacterium]|nr:hypothetical protein [Eubacteriales bacterium]